MEKTHVKLLFLDVDGVINYHKCKNEFDKKLLLKLYKIVKLTQCKIIISSTYRLENHSIKRLWNALENVEISKKNILYQIIKKHLIF